MTVYPNCQVGLIFIRPNRPPPSHSPERLCSTSPNLVGRGKMELTGGTKSDDAIVAPTPTILGSSDGSVHFAVAKTNAVVRIFSVCLRKSTTQLMLCDADDSPHTKRDASV